MRYVSVCKEVDLSLFPRIVHASLLLSNSIRRDTILCVNVSGVGTVRIDGRRARRVYPDEESLLGLLKALQRGKRLYGVELADCCDVQKPCISPGKEDKISVIKGDVYITPWEERDCYSVAGLEPFEIDQRIIVLQATLDRWLK